MPVNQTPTKVTLSHPSGSSAEVLFFGATILSWKTKDGKERLFLSSKANLDGSKAVRGGIPLVFPVFGKVNSGKVVKLAQHGFARNSIWTFERTRQDDDAKVAVSLTLKDSEATRELWPYSFHLRYVITLTADHLEPVIQITNDSKEPFDFNVLFHTYFNVPDISKAKIHGLKGLQYRDKVQHGALHTEKNDGISIISETDRVYIGSQDQLRIETGDSSYGDVSIRKTGFKDTVVWNPWVNAPKNMADFGPEDAHTSMLCVEVGSVAEFTSLPAGETWQGGQLLSIA